MPKEKNIEAVTIPKFVAMVTNSKWVSSDRGHKITGSYFDEKEGVNIIFGYAWETRTFGEVTIKYTEFFHFYKGHPDTFVSIPEYWGPQFPKTWVVEGVKVIEEDFDGEEEEVTADVLSQHVPKNWHKIFYEFMDIDFGPLRDDEDEVYAS